MNEEVILGIYRDNDSRVQRKRVKHAVPIDPTLRDKRK